MKLIRRVWSVVCPRRRVCTSGTARHSRRDWIATAAAAAERSASNNSIYAPFTGHRCFSRFLKLVTRRNSASRLVSCVCLSRCLSLYSGVAKICCEEGQIKKLEIWSWGTHGKLQGCSSCLMTSSFMTNAVLIQCELLTSAPADLADYTMLSCQL